MQTHEGLKEIAVCHFPGLGAKLAHRDRFRERVPHSSLVLRLNPNQHCVGITGIQSFASRAYDGAIQAVAMSEYRSGH